MKTRRDGSSHGPCKLENPLEFVSTHSTTCKLFPIIRHVSLKVKTVKPGRLRARAKKCDLREETQLEKNNDGRYFPVHVR